jgi:hypothetical protein
VALRESREYRKWRERVLNLLRYTVAGGLVELSIPDGILSQKEWAQLTTRSPYRFLIRASMKEERSSAHIPVSRLTVLDDSDICPSEIERVMMIDRPRHIIVTPSSARDPRALNRRLVDMVRQVSIDDLLVRLQA